MGAAAGLEGFRGIRAVGLRALWFESLGLRSSVVPKFQQGFL